MLAGFVYRVLRRAVGLCVLHGLSLRLDEVNPRLLAAATPFDCCFLEADENEGHARDPRNALPLAFVRTAVERGDECLGFLDGDDLASYGWYSHQPIPVLSRVMVCFDGGYLYMHHGYTRPEYRGLRLHGLGLARATRVYASRGKKGLVSLLEMGNLGSRRSVEYVGFRWHGASVMLGRRILIRPHRPSPLKLSKLSE